MVLGEIKADGELVHVGGVLIEGLAAAIERTASGAGGELVSIPDVVVSPMDGERSECGRWLASWLSPEERRDLLLRDNRKKRWIALRETWISGRRGDGTAILCIERAELTTGPSI